MKEKINLWSLVFSFVCIGLFTIPWTRGTFNTTVEIHPLYIVLVITLITFIFGIYGLSGVHNKRAFVRSIITLILTLSLSVFIMFILFVGELLG